MHEIALILIDIQNDYFPQGRMPLPNMESAAANAARLLDIARVNDHLIVHVRHIAPSNAPFFRTGTSGSEIRQTVTPRSGEIVVEKSRPNSFLHTDLERILREAHVEKLILCGAMSQMCVDATSRAAADLGFQVNIAADACAAADLSFEGTEVPAKMVHAAIMHPLGSSYARVASTDVFVGEFT